MLNFPVLILAGVLFFAGSPITGIELPAPFAPQGEILRICCPDKSFEETLLRYYPDYEPEGDFSSDGRLLTKKGRIGDTLVCIDVVEGGTEPYEEYLDGLLLHGEDTDPDDCADLFIISGTELSKYCSAGADVTVPLEDLFPPDEMEEQFSFMRESAKDEEGVERASAWEVPCGVFLYRRSAAAEVFGTDDPAEIRRNCSDWISFMKMALTLKQHGFCVLAGADETFDVYLSDSAPWVDENGTIVISESAKEWAEQMSELYVNGCLGTERRGTDGWKEKLFSEGADVFGCFMTVPEIRTLFSGNGDSPLSSEDWGFCRGPETFIRGGYYIAAARGTDNRDLAGELIRTLTCDAGVLERYALDTGGISNHLHVMEKLAGNDGGVPFLPGGEGNTAVLADAVKSIGASASSPYDGALKEIFLEAYLPYITGDTDESEALAGFYTSSLERFPFLSEI